MSIYSHFVIMNLRQRVMQLRQLQPSQRNRLHPAAASVPRVPGLPLIGNFLDFRRDRLGLHQLAAEIGPIARFALGPLNLHVITDGELAHQVLTTEADAFIKARGISEFLQPLLGEGLLSAEGQLHKRHRKLLAPAFAPKRMASYAEVMVAEARTTAAAWRPGQRVDLAEEMMAMTLAIAGKTMFGQDLRSDAEKIGHALTEAMESMMLNLTSAVRLPYEWPVPRHRGMRRAVATLNEVVYNVIAQRRHESPAQLAERRDVLSMLLLARDEDGDGAGFTDQQIRDEVMTLLLAGHETTANALTWTLYELGRHPAIANELVTQIDAALDQRDATPADCDKIPLALAVVEESMRLHPPAYVVSREATRDVTIGGHVMPKGATILINVRGIHRHPAYWESPLQFSPERMSTEAKKARSRHVYLPFGGGPRVCIGSHFALLEAQLCLITLLQRGTIQTLAKHREPEALVTLRPKGGLPGVVSPRITH
ncbi:MAG: cytochrome P450 [Kofleriaceae bacterium]|nr:cytochrome P450 [Kofleriaceae bacterium]